MNNPHGQQRLPAFVFTLMLIMCTVFGYAASV